MANLIGAGLAGGAVPPPIEYYVQDNFEGRVLAPEWTTDNLVEVDEWTILGVDGPVGGGAMGARIPTNGTLRIAIPETDTIWSTFWVLTPAVGMSPVYFATVYHDTDRIHRMRNYPNSNFQWENSGDGNTYIGSKIYTPGTWYKFKYHVYLHATAGIIQVWYDEGSGWVIDIDESGIDTIKISGLANTVYAYATAGRSQNFYDEYNILKADPGSEMRR